MGRWDGAGGASHSGCVGSVGGMGKGGSRAKLGVSESKSEEIDSEVLGLRETSRRSSMPLGKRPGHRELVSGINMLHIMPCPLSVFAASPSASRPG